LGITFRDLFTSSINGAWSVTDTGSNLSVVAGRALFDGGLGSPVWGNPGLVYGPLNRSTLGAFTALIRLTNNSDDGPRVALSPSSTNSSATGASHLTFDYPDTFGGWQTNRQRGRAADYLFTIVPRPGGGFWRFLSGGEYGDFVDATLVGISDTETDATLYAHLANNNSVFHVDNATVLDTGSLPAALTTRFGPARAADDFGSGASLSGRSTPYGSKAWSVAAGSGSISGGTVLLAASTTAQFDAGGQCRVVEGTFTRVDSGSKGFLYFRGDGTHAGSWRAEVVSDRVAVYNSGGLVDQTGAITFTEDVAYKVRIVDWADYLEVHVDGTRYLQITDSTGSGNTRVGAGSDAGGTVRVDDLSAWPATVVLNSDFGPYTTVPEGQGAALTSDAFAAANGTALTTYDAGWTAHTGTWEINSNRARMTAAGVNGIATRSTGAAGVNHEVKADITLPSTTPAYPIDWFAAVFARYTDGDQFLMARFLYQDTSNEVELWQFVANVGTLIGYTNLGVGVLAPSSTHNLALAVYGAEAAAYMDGMLVVQATTTVLTGARAGMGVDDNLPNGQPSWDNLEIRAAQLITNPTISNIQVGSITSTTAVVTCTTDIAAVVRVNYGPTTAYGLATADGASGTSHSRTLTGLTPNTTYHYQVRAES
jgi:hypothetical protein